MMKQIDSTANGKYWIEYAKRAAQYGAELRAMGLPHDHAERVRAREAIRRGLREARRERRKYSAARRLIAVLTAHKKALAAA